MKRLASKYLFEPLHCLPKMYLTTFDIYRIHIFTQKWNIKLQNTAPACQKSIWPHLTSRWYIFSRRNETANFKISFWGTRLSLPKMYLTKHLTSRGYIFSFRNETLNFKNLFETMHCLPNLFQKLSPALVSSYNSKSSKRKTRANWSLVIEDGLGRHCYRLMNVFTWTVVGARIFKRLRSPWIDSDGLCSLAGRYFKWCCRTGPPSWKSIPGRYNNNYRPANAPGYIGCRNRFKGSLKSLKIRAQ